MTSHAFRIDGGDRPDRNLIRSGVLRLGWLHFWLLAGTLGGMLALVALVFLISFSAR
jgi:hypothetical protein